jgi:hypothetical protein
MGERMERIGKTMTAAITLPIAAAGIAAFKYASDLSENINKADVAFKENAKEVEAWSGTTLESFGIAKVTSLDMAATFGDMATSMGINTANAATMSTSLVGLAGDLASFKNIRIDVANTALNGVFTGETESLKQLGIVMTQANLDEYALSKGIKIKTQDMNQASQVQLRYAYIMEKTTNAQGDFIRTGGGAANQMRIFQESMKELGATIGTKLLPIITPIITKLNQWVQAFAGLDERSQKIILVVAGIAAAIGPVILIVGSLISAVSTIIGVFTAASAAIAAAGGAIAILTGPIGITIAVVAGLIAVGVLLYKNWDMVKIKTLQAWGDIKSVVLGNVSALVGGIAVLFDTVGLDNYAAKARAAQASLAVSIDMEKELRHRRGVAELFIGTSSSVSKAPDIETPKAFVPDLSGITAAADTSKKAAEDTRTEWAKTADLLGIQLQEITSQFEVAANTQKMSGDKVAEFAVKTDGLNKQMELQKQIVQAVNSDYIVGLNNAKLTIEEKEKLRLKVEQERKALSDLEVQQYDNVQAQKAMAKSLSDLSSKVVEVRDKFNNDMAQALADYQKQVATVNSKLLTDEQNLTQAYERTLKQRTDALSNFVGLFDAVTSKSVTGNQLLSNLQGQVDTFGQWQGNINALATKGIDEGLLAELREMGPSAASEIAALNTLSAPELAQYVALWQEKSNMARASAQVELESQRVETINKIAQLRSEAAVQLEAYKVEWEKKNAEIRANTQRELAIIAKEYEDITGKSFSQGALLVSNFATGMESQFDRLQSAISNMYAIVGAGAPSVQVSSVSNVTSIPKLASGTNNVPEDMLAIIHKGEAVVPAPYNKGTSGTTIGDIYVTGSNADEIWEKLKRELTSKGVKISA